MHNIICPNKFDIGLNKYYNIFLDGQVMTDEMVKQENERVRPTSIQLNSNPKTLFNSNQISLLCQCVLQLFTDSLLHRPSPSLRLPF